MITLRMASYRKNEVQTLIDLLTNCQKELAPKCHTAPMCRNCEIKHLCVDITSALSFAEDYIENMTKENAADV